MMGLKTVIRVFLVLVSMNTYSQNNNYQSIILSPELLTNANSIIRLNNVTIEIKAYNKMLKAETYCYCLKVFYPKMWIEYFL